MKKILKLKDIELDKNNPRYATRKNEDQSIANFMITHTKLSQINDMVKDIIEKGLSPLDIIGVFKENEKYIALDGNRRVLALKILFENDNINLPDSTKSIVSQFKSNNDIEKTKLKEKIDVFVFSNRIEAKDWLNRKHTQDFGGASAQDWPTLEKKIFQEEPLALFIAEECDIAGISYDDYAIKIKYTIWERMLTSEFSRKWMGVSYSKESKQFIANNREQLKERINAIIKAVDDKILNFNKVIKKRNKSNTIKKINEKYLSNSNFPLSFTLPNKKRKSKINIKKYIKLDSMPDMLKEIIDQCNTINHDKKTFLATFPIRPIIEYSINYYLKVIRNKSQDSLKMPLKKKLKSVLIELQNHNLKEFQKYWLKNREYSRIIDHLNWTIHFEGEWKIDKNYVARTIFAVNLLIKAIWKSKD